MSSLRPLPAPARGLTKLRHPFVQAALAGFVGMVAIVVGSLIASQRAGQAEALNDVRSRTEIVAQLVLEPNLSPELLAGDQSATEAFDAIVTSLVLDGSTLRVKLWNASGVVVYSDEHRLIGERYALDADRTASLTSGEVVSEISSLDGPENRFETIDGEALEVYLPIDGPDGEQLLFEAYYSMAAVDASSDRIRTEFAPIVLTALLIMQAMNFGLAWALNRRLRRSQRDRERLLQRAIDSSRQERRRIAADLRDGVVQDLTETEMAIAGAAREAVNSSNELSGNLRSASAGAKRSLQSLRSLLVDIYPPNLTAHGLEAALVDLLAPAASMGITTELLVVGDVDRSLETSALLYRVVQEAVRNVFRHAEATTVRVEVSADGRDTVAVVSDDGRGFDASVRTAPNGQLGLRLLTDLVDDAGARLLVESAPGAGTSIRVEIPE